MPQGGATASLAIAIPRPSTGRFFVIKIFGSGQKDGQEERLVPNEDALSRSDIRLLKISAELVLALGRKVYQGLFQTAIGDSKRCLVRWSCVCCHSMMHVISPQQQ